MSNLPRSALILGFSGTKEHRDVVGSSFRRPSRREGECKNVSQGEEKTRRRGKEEEDLERKKNSDRRGSHS